MPESIAATANSHLHARVSVLHPAPVPESGQYVLYWMHQARRRHYNFALQHAIYRAKEHQCGVLVVEDICLEQTWIGRRHIAFALRGMIDNQQDFARLSWLHYLPLIEREPGQLRHWGPLLVAGAVEVVTEQVPCGIPLGINQHLMTWAQEHQRRLTTIDGNGFLPLNLLDGPCSTAAAFRRHVHRHAAAAWQAQPAQDPCRSQRLPAWQLPATWQAWSADDLLAHPAGLAALPLDHAVPEVPGRGGRRAGLQEMQQWLADGLSRYDQRNQPDASGASGLSPYMHWGHISTWDVLNAVVAQDPAWDPGLLPEKGGKRLGFWPLAEPSQLLCDELLTWRELSYHTAQLQPDTYDRYDGLPQFALNTLAQHAADQRQWVYDLDDLTAARTAEPLWNAIQNQLLKDGVIHNYLRMLWGKCILAWSATPELAWDHLVELNNRWALDGRNPNSYAGIAWVMGRYDHPWPERNVFGSVRSMTIASTGRKLDLKQYLSRWSVASASIPETSM